MHRSAFVRSLLDVEKNGLEICPRAGAVILRDIWYVWYLRRAHPRDDLLNGRKSPPLVQAKRAAGFDMVIGVDEAGRGPFAGGLGWLSWDGGGQSWGWGGEDGRGGGTWVTLAQSFKHRPYPPGPRVA